MLGQSSGSTNGAPSAIPGLPGAVGNNIPELIDNLVKEYPYLAPLVGSYGPAFEGILQGISNQQLDQKLLPSLYGLEAAGLGLQAGFAGQRAGIDQGYYALMKQLSGEELGLAGEDWALDLRTLQNRLLGLDNQWERNINEFERLRQALEGEAAARGAIVSQGYRDRRAQQDKDLWLAQSDVGLAREQAKIDYERAGPLQYRREELEHRRRVAGYDRLSALTGLDAAEAAARVNNALAQLNLDHYIKAQDIESGLAGSFGELGQLWSMLLLDAVGLIDLVEGSKLLSGGSALSGGSGSSSSSPQSALGIPKEYFDPNNPLPPSGFPIG